MRRTHLGAVAQGQGEDGGVEGLEARVHKGVAGDGVVDLLRLYTCVGMNG